MSNGASLAPQLISIGLININERIKLMFGSDYGLQLYNEDDKAVAQIDIPYLVI